MSFRAICLISVTGHVFLYLFVILALFKIVSSESIPIIAAPGCVLFYLCAVLVISLHTGLATLVVLRKNPSQTGQTVVSQVSVWYQSGIGLVSIWCRSGIGLVPVWCQSGASLVSVWCQSGISLVSVWYQSL